MDRRSFIKGSAVAAGAAPERAEHDPVVAVARDHDRQRGHHPRAGEDAGPRRLGVDDEGRGAHGPDATPPTRSDFAGVGPTGVLE